MNTAVAVKRNVTEENRAYWTHRAPTYSMENRTELMTDQREIWKTVISSRIDRAFPNRDRSSIRVLEVGTGPGFFAIILAEAGYDVTAVDLTPAMLEQARVNAGKLLPKIRFYEMNAEALDFEDASFDVVLSRNLTWNLPHPCVAYEEWNRVLTEHGRLLNFDANWYRYLFDSEARDAYERDRTNSAEAGVDDLNVGEHFDRMEDIARRVPLSRVDRPQWDVDALTALGLSVETDHRIWERVWSRQEKINLASTPMFLVCGTKRDGVRDQAMSG